VVHPRQVSAGDAQGVALEECLRVAWFPKAEDLQANPYWTRLQAELEALGVAFETSHNGHWLAGRWLWENRRRVDVLHFHFMEPQYAGVGDTVSARRVLKFAAYLALARLLGYRIVWTMHELSPTWPMRPAWLERLGRGLLAWAAHVVIVHCHEAKRLLARKLGRWWRVCVLPVPTYAEFYPQNLSRVEARAALEIAPDCFVIGFVGGIRPNKGLEDLVAVFGQLDDPNSRLLIAGKPWPPEDYVAVLQQLAATDTRIRFHAEEVPDQDLQLYLTATDVVVFPFKHVLTSSSVALAMSFGRPVVVPRLGCLPELVGADAGILYEPGDIASLAAALRQARESDLEAMGRAAARRANAFSWRDLAEATLKVYQAA